MTRDEAEKAVQEAWPKVSNLGAQQGIIANVYHQGAQQIQNAYNAPMSPKVFIKLAEALGLLRLDEPIVLCGEDPDWNWWLSQPKEFKAAAVKGIRKIVDR